MKPDNQLSRLIRPTLIIWLTALFSALMVIDGNFYDITIKDVYIKVLESILIVVYGSYFIAKSAEHITRINNKGDSDV